MKKFFLLFSFLFFAFAIHAQKINSDSLKSKFAFENIQNQKLFGDSLTSSFVIFIKKEVPLHKHIFHSEHVWILEGEAEMILGNEKFKISKGDCIFIPKNTPHKVSVTSSIPLKIISIQSPNFDGSDRVLLE